MICDRFAKNPTVRGQMALGKLSTGVLFKLRLSILGLLFLLISLSLGAQDESLREDALREFQQGNYNRALEITLRELSEDPSNMDAYTVLGWSLLRLNRHNDAVRYAERALRVRRYDYRILHIMGEALFFLDQDQEALRYFEEYAAIHPGGNRIAQIYYYMGEIFLRVREYHRADIAFSVALHHSPRVAQWWGRLGYARSRNGDLEYSLSAYDEALRLNSSLREAQEGRQQVLERLSQG